MKVKVAIGIAILLFAVVAGVVAFWPGNGKVMLVPGVVEIQEVRLGSKVGGRVEAVLVQEGTEIYPRQRLIVFEAPELKNQRLQVQARLDSAIAEWQRAVNGPRAEEKDAAQAAMKSAKARWDRAEFGWRVEEKQQAQSDLESADAEYEQANKEWLRITPLFRKQAVSSTEFEAAVAARDRSRSRKEFAKAKVEMMAAGTRKEDKEEALQELRRATAQYELLRIGTRQEEKDMAKAKVDELRANLEAIEINLLETTLIAPPNLGKAMVEVVAVRPGDLVPPNQSIVRVLRVQDLWVKIYVPETDLGKITVGMKVDVTIDSHARTVFKGEVIQRATIAEFTPRNVQSVDERRHQVFGVKIRIDDPQGVFNAGMAAEVAIPLK